MAVVSQHTHTPYSVAIFLYRVALFYIILLCCHAAAITYARPALCRPLHNYVIITPGPAGLSAALGARRAGADVILMERFGCFGGVITTVGMETLGWYRYEGE